MTYSHELFSREAKLIKCLANFLNHTIEAISKKLLIIIILLDITVIAADYSLFLENDGSVWGCCGNAAGQLLFLPAFISSALLMAKIRVRENL